MLLAISAVFRNRLCTKAANGTAPPSLTAPHFAIRFFANETPRSTSRCFCAVHHFPRSGCLLDPFLHLVSPFSTVSHRFLSVLTPPFDHISPGLFPFPCANVHAHAYLAPWDPEDQGRVAVNLL